MAIRITRVLFTQEEWHIIQKIFSRVCDNIILAKTVFETRDLNLAKELLNEKTFLRDAELLAKNTHYDNLHSGKPENIETTALQLDIIGNLKRINSYLASNAISLFSKKV